MNYSLKFKRCVDVVLSKEGGYTNNPNDAGNWTGGEQGKGELKGTKYGISAKTYPDLDIKNLTREDAIAIYHRDFWAFYNCEQYSSPLALCVFDAYVNTSPEYVKQWLAESTGYASFMTARMLDYTSFRDWKYFGKGWTRRIMQVLAIASRWDEEGQGSGESPEDQRYEVGILVFNQFRLGDFLRLHILLLKREQTKLKGSFAFRKRGDKLDISRS